MGVQNNFDLKTAKYRSAKYIKKVGEISENYCTQSIYTQEKNPPIKDF